MKEGKDQKSIQSSITPDPGYTNGKVTTSQLDITNESQEVSPLQAGNHKAPTNRRAQKHNKTRQKQLTQMIHKRSTAPQQSAKLFHWSAQTGLTAHQPHPSPDVDQTHRRPVHMKDPQLSCDDWCIIYNQMTGALFIT